MQEDCNAYGYSLLNVLSARPSRPVRQRIPELSGAYLDRAQIVHAVDSILGGSGLRLDASRKVNNTAMLSACAGDIRSSD